MSRRQRVDKDNSTSMKEFALILGLMFIPLVGAFLGPALMIKKFLPKLTEKFGSKDGSVSE